ncbi:phosphatase PAP2 family protein [Metamycoplasma auris]|uniref:PAP2 superfamily protein n=1 Tax=Metamycoplasma auris TaxID=51363 RepID=A0A2W7G4Q9_9BACT|nr:phosphatase PAP2 family protein [Metamycoplasma auris]PZW01572.1 PAP2 superfamily protein [Metamycoplasma auris]
MSNNVRYKSKKEKDTVFNLVFFSLLALFFISLISFIISSPYSGDLKLAKFFEQAFLKSEFARYWSVFMEISGNTLLGVFLFFAAMVIFETLFLVKAKNSKKNLWFQYRWILNAGYFIYPMIFICVLCYKAYIGIKTGNGFGSEGDAIYATKFIYRKVALISTIFVHLALFIWGGWYLHFKFARSQDFLTNKYWVESIKFILFSIISYIIIILVKGLTSRPYYYNVIYGDLLESVKQEHPEWVSYYLSQNWAKHGFDLGDGKYAGNIPLDIQLPWYVINGKPFKPDPQLKFFDNWVDWAFPSGHVIATLNIGLIFFFFLSNNKTLNYKKIIWIVVYLIYFWSMAVGLIVNRAHWVSDIAFSFLWGAPLVAIVHYIGLKIKKKHAMKI